MTPALRRTHRAIWLTLAVALPAGFIAGLLSRSPLPMQEPVGPVVSAPLPVLVRSVTLPAFTVSLRKASQTPDLQLEIMVKNALDVPSAVVRVRQQTGWQAVGLLNAPGLYRFALPGAGTHPQLDIRDDIHRQTLQTIQL